MQWVIDQLNSKVVRSKLRTKTQHKKEARLLKFCDSCKRIYSRDFMYSTEVYYDNLCSYKLPRKKCQKCRGVK